MCNDDYARSEAWQQLDDEYLALQRAALMGQPVSVRYWLDLAERLQTAWDTFVASVNR